VLTATDSWLICPVLANSPAGTPACSVRTCGELLLS
jgi:hypothetical protein